jgi:two-component sensor histidine kinase
VAWRRWLPSRAPPLWASIANGAALAVAGALVRLALQGPLGSSLPFITFFPMVALAASLGGAPSGVSCLVVASITTVFFQGRLDALALALFWLAGGTVVIVASALVDTVRSLRESQAALAETHRRLETLVGELAHRNRNALSVMMSIVSQSAARANSAAEAAQIINARIQALVRAQDVLIKADSAMAALRSIVEGALEPFDLSRFDLDDGGAFMLDGDVAVGLGLLFHELATNALKYGALSAPEGRIAVRWRPAGELAILTWQEAGGPAVSAPERRGFGSRLLDTALMAQGGKVVRRFEPDGLVCDFQIPSGRPATTARPGQGSH